MILNYVIKGLIGGVILIDWFEAIHIRLIGAHYHRLFGIQILSMLLQSSPRRRKNGNGAKKEEKETTELTIITENVEANKGTSKQDY